MASPSLRTYTPEELEEQDIGDLLTTFVAAQARQWQRRARNRLAGPLRLAIDEARARGDRVDAATLLRDVFMEWDLPSLLAEQTDENSSQEG